MRFRDAECVICGGKFTTSKPFVKYCSDACRRQSNLDAQAERRKKRKAEKKPVRRLCRECHKPFMATHGSAWTCSDACKREAHRKSRAAWFKRVGLALSRGNVIRRRCKACKKSFVVTRFRKKYCSPTCSGRGRA